MDFNFIFLSNCAIKFNKGLFLHHTFYKTLVTFGLLSCKVTLRNCITCYEKQNITVTQTYCNIAVSTKKHTEGQARSKENTDSRYTHVPKYNYFFTFGYHK